MSQKLAFTCAPPFFFHVRYLLRLLPGASDAALNEGQHLHSSLIRFERDAMTSFLSAQLGAK